MSRIHEGYEPDPWHPKRSIALAAAVIDTEDKRYAQAAAKAKSARERMTLKGKPGALDVRDLDNDTQRRIKAVVARARAAGTLGNGVT